MLSELKRIQKERGCTNKELAEATKTSEASVGRYLKGETDAPFEFVAKAAEHLGVSLNALAGIPEKEIKDEMYEHIRELYEAQLQNKDDHIAALKRRVEKLEEAHEKERTDMRQRMDRKNKIIMRLFLALTVISMASLYFVVDAYNGDWGLVRYESLLELLPDVFGSTEHTLPDTANDLTGLWLRN